MKMLYKILFTTAFLASTIVSFAHKEKENETTKDINKSFKVSDKVVVKMDINFADVSITTWDQPQVDVDIKLRSEASSQSRAEEIMDKIEVKIDGSENLVNIHVELQNTNCKNNEQFDIDVNIKMPANGSLEGQTSFGDLNLTSLKGACKLHIQYGDFEAIGLSSGANNVKVSFGNFNVQNYGGGELTNEYSQVEIDQLSGNCNIKASFGNVDIDLLSAACRDLTIEVEYGNAELKLSPGASYNLEALAEYGNVDFPEGAKTTFVEKDYSGEHYKGTIGSGGGGTINITAAFGNVEFQ